MAFVCVATVNLDMFAFGKLVPSHVLPICYVRESRTGESFLLTSCSFYSHKSGLLHHRFLGVLSLSLSRSPKGSASLAFQRSSQSERIFHSYECPHLKGSVDFDKATYSVNCCQSTSIQRIWKKRLSIHDRVCRASCTTRFFASSSAISAGDFTASSGIGPPITPGVS